MMADYETILYDRKNSVATITLNRPDRRNAIIDLMLKEISHALKTAQKDAGVRAIVFTGAGKGFCAGQDLNAFAGPLGDNQVYEHLRTYYLPVIQLVQTVEKPVIAAVSGVAAGAGASLALSCDLRIMADDASILQAFSNIALVPDAGSTWFLVRLVGYSRAYEIAIEGERIPARRCLEIGLANRVVPAGVLRSEAQAWAEKLAQRPTQALGLTKRAMNRALLTDLAATIEYEAHLQQIAVQGYDFEEGVTAFKEKRAQVFEGR
jgi:2-(1,2-epoxy-1,2-dihydrophenyl)acetyl-CoA isomerase